MPTELTERQKTILEAVIRQYVHTAEPVASGELVHKYRLACSPATVRGELLALDEGGYLAQPHTSAGRVPTDKGYRFYINHLTGGDGIGSREERMFRGVKELNDPAEFVRHVSRMLAHCSGNFALAGFPEDELFSRYGLAEVLRSPEFSDPALMHEFSQLVDRIEDELMELFEPAEFDEPRTFVGRENPIPEAKHYGMIISAVETPFEKESIIALVGPKRMDYERNVALLKNLRNVLAH